MTPIAARIAEVVRRHVSDLRFTKLEDAAASAAVRVLADDEIAAGLRATTTLAALNARHQPRAWEGSDIRVCAACQTAWPCPDRNILDGKPAEQPAAVTR